jgi:hypothetical protein
MKRNNRFYKIVSGVVTILFIINSVAYAAPDGTWSLQKNSALRTVSTAEDAQTRESLGGALKDAQAKSINILRGLKER